MAGKYVGWERLFADLRARGEPEVQLSLADLEDAIGDTLPASAYQYPAWWSGERHYAAWRKHGWSARPKLKDRVVTFVLTDDVPSVAPPTAAPRASPRPSANLIGVQDLNDIRREMRRLCDRLESNRTRNESLPGRIGRLLEADLLDPIPGALMRCLNTLRNQVEYGDVDLTQVESEAVRFMWRAVLEWAERRLSSVRE